MLEPPRRLPRRDWWATNKLHPTGALRILVRYGTLEHGVDGVLAFKARSLRIDVIRLCLPTHCIVSLLEANEILFTHAKRKKKLVHNFKFATQYSTSI